MLEINITDFEVHVTGVTILFHSLFNTLFHFPSVLFNFLVNTIRIFLAVNSKHKQLNLNYVNILWYFQHYYAVNGNLPEILGIEI